MSAASRRSETSSNTIYTTLASTIVVPFIHRFFSTIFKKTSETLILEYPSLGRSTKYEACTENNNNNDGEEASKPVTLSLLNPIHFCWRIVLHSKIGLGEAYMAGDWTAQPGPTELLETLIRAKKETRANCPRTPSVSRSLLNKTLSLLATASLFVLQKAVAIVNYIQHRIKDNTVANAASNIRDHYDIGNDMFQLFLDPSMTYSCAVFPEAGVPVPHSDMTILEAAQMKKIDALIDMMDLSESDHVLEIGCGWGAAAIRAVQRSGCRWTGITISHEQLEWGIEKVKEAGLADKIDLKYLDYRLETGSYSRVLSIEMIEAVGEAYLPTFFQCVHDRLQPGGKAVLQGIICPDSYYPTYCRNSDFIKKYIFPGGHMPSLGAIQKSLPAGLSTTSTRVHIGRHYATTLNHWHAAFNENRSNILSLGYSEMFHRKWQFYFALCSALFAHDHIDAVQFDLVREE